MNFCTWVGAGSLGQRLVRLAGVRRRMARRRPTLGRHPAVGSPRRRAKVRAAVLRPAILRRLLKLLMLLLEGWPLQ